jgi:phenylalanyl-tRNA synthetase beta chain
MRTLDGELRTFDHETLLITDGGGAVAVGGVMGGLDSEVGQETTDILLEAANFNFLNIRRTCRLLQLSSEASQRFGRRVDPELTVPAAARAAWLMAEHADGTVEPVIGDLYPGRLPQPVIDFDPAEATRLLGTEIPLEDMKRILSSLEFEVAAQPSTGHLRVAVPSHRQDVTRAVDLVEEVGRIWGYDRFPRTLIIRDEIPPQRPNLVLEGAERVRDLLIGVGLDEVITYSVVDLGRERMLYPGESPVDPRRYLKLRNPVSADREYLRQTLLPSLLWTARENLRFVDRVGIFELGSTYVPVEGQLLPDEPRKLAVLMTGPREARSWLPGQDRSLVDFFDLKGVVEALLGGLHLEASFEPGDHPALHPGRCAALRIGDKVIGVLGELHPTVRDVFELPDQPVCVLEFDVDGLLAMWRAPVKLNPISAHPPIYEDLAVVVPSSVPAVQVRDLIAQTGGALLRSVILFDVYQGEQVGSGKKSLAYRLTYQADDRTLTDKAAGKVRQKIIRRLEREVGATLRA